MRNIIGFLIEFALMLLIGESFRFSGKTGNNNYYLLGMFFITVYNVYSHIRDIRNIRNRIKTSTKIG